MHPILKKLQYKDQDPILVLGAPEGLKPLLSEWREGVNISHDPGSAGQFTFMLFFALHTQDIHSRLDLIEEKLAPDGLLWWAYPKKTSKNYHSEINRDEGWEALGRLGFEGVRQIAIDEDWSALRFRKAENIKTMTRRSSMALSETGKRRTTKPKSDE